MLQSRTVLGLGTIDTSDGSAKSPMAALMDFIKNPMHAALGIAVYLVWFLTAKVDASQDAIRRQLDAQAVVLGAIAQSDAARALHEREHDVLLRMICRGVNKGDAKEKCDQ